MKYWKHLACLLLIVVAVLMVPTEAQAAEIVDSGTCGDNLTWTLTDDGTLTISGEGEMKDWWLEYSAPWCAHRSSIKDAVIETGVTSIGDYAFYCCTSLASITIGDSVTSIGNDAFQDCTSLTSVMIPNSVTSIGDYVFAGCTSLASIETDNNSNYRSADGVLFNKDMSTLICYPAGKTNTSYTIPDSVTSIGSYAFEGCSSLTGITIPDGVTSIGDSAFRGCTSLASITIPDGVTSIGWSAFRGCSSLTGITIPDGVTSIGWYAFMDCSSLTSITIPGGVTSIDRSAFSGCSSLTSITIPDSVTSIDNSAFSGCSSLASITIPDSVTSISDGAFHDCSSLTSITIPDGVTSIGDWAFDGCSSLTSITIPDSVTSIGRYAFRGCSSLTTVYYTGNEEQWDAVTIGTNNNPLLNAEFVFNYVPPMDAPTLTVSNDAATGKNKLAWNEVAGAESYEIWVSTSKNGTYSKLGTVTKTTATHSSATAGKTYYYKVRAIAGDVKGEPSEAVGKTCDLARPTVTVTNDAATGKPTLTWEAVPGADKYEVYAATSKNGTYTKLGTVTATTATHKAAVAGEAYYYRVKAIYAANSGANSAASIAVGKTCDLARPTVTATNDAATGKIVISWKAVPGADRYEVYRATSKNGTYKKLTTTTKLSVTNSSINAGETYYYRVKAIFDGNSGADSAASVAVGKTCDLARPVVTITLNSKGKPVLSWKEIDGAVGYEIWCSTSKNGTYTRLGTITGLKATISSAESGVTYYYRVKAICKVSGGDSAASVPQSVTVG